MVLLKCSKILLAASLMLPLAFATVAVGILFGCYNIAASKNPEEAEAIYNSSMTTFMLIETFVFTAMTIAVFIIVVY